MEIRGYRVYYLDPEEDINSLLDELGQSKSERLALVVDQRSHIFNSRINLQLLQKYLNDWGKDLVFITTEKRLIRLALETNMTVYPELDALKLDEPILDVEAPLVTSLTTEELLPEMNQIYNQDDEEIPMYRSRRRKSSWGSRIVLSLFAVLLLGGLVWLYVDFPMITVEVSPTINKLEKELLITCEYGLGQIRTEEQKIPMLTIKHDVQSETAVSTSGRKKIGFTRSEGVVVFVNNQSKEITVPADTIVQTGTGIKFKTIQAVKVPEVKAEYLMGVLAGTKAGTAEVNIVALEAGTAGNVASGRITQFVAQDQGLQVINPEATQGGADREEMVVTQRDLDQALSQLEKELKNMLNLQLAEEVGTDYLMLNDTLQYQLDQVSLSHHLDEKAEEIQASGKMTVSGYFLLKNDVRMITEELYYQDLPENYQLYSENIQITEIKSSFIEENKVELKMKAVGQVIAKIKPDQIIKNVKGQTIEYADGILSRMQEIRYFRILADGKSRIPKFTPAIRVIVKDPAESEEGSI